MNAIMDHGTLKVDMTGKGACRGNGAEFVSRVKADTDLLSESGQIQIERCSL
ncbi:MAG: hypothetical protein ACNA7J_01210 [Wenzhouxiangella sp.]